MGSVGGNGIDFNVNINVASLLGGIPTVSFYYFIFSGFVAFLASALIYRFLHGIKYIFVWLTTKTSELIITWGLNALISFVTGLSGLLIALLVARQEAIVTQYVVHAVGTLLRLGATDLPTPMTE